MRVLVDICHPAHFHFFRNPIKLLKERGHDVHITSRDKDVTLSLIENEGWSHSLLCATAESNSGLMKELVRRNIALYRLVKHWKPDVMAAIGGIFISQVGLISRTPSVVFYDTENAKLQNMLTYPFASIVSVPECYESWIPRHTVRYPGYHELSYLHPKYFTPSIERAKSNGLAEEGDTYLVRIVAWKANHDIGEAGWSPDLLRDLVAKLAVLGKVIISAEVELPSDLMAYRYQGTPSEIHHLMAFCRLFVGESATMASESVALGVPAVYAAKTGRGYCNEQEHTFGMLKNVEELTSAAILRALDELLALSQIEIGARWNRMLEAMVDVPAHVVGLIEEAGTNARILQNRSSG